MITKLNIDFGVVQYTYWDDSRMPLGIIWVRFALSSNNKIIGFVLNAMTSSFHRRKKVCTELHNALLCDCTVIISPTASTDGEMFVKNFGFKFDEQLGIWYFLKGE